jgi:hypothetical protein
LTSGDSAGDGWHGGTIDVLVNGNIVLNDVTFYGSYASYNFSVNPGDTITTNFVGASYANECEYVIKNENSQVVVYSGQLNLTPENKTYIVPADFTLNTGDIISLSKTSAGFDNAIIQNGPLNPVTITEYGYIYEAGQSPVWGDSPKEITGTNVIIPGGTDYPIATTTLTGLVQGWEYYASSYATDGINVWFGDEIIFTTCPEDTILDNDPWVCGAVVNYEIPEMVAFSDTFIQGQAYGNCNKWETFCSELLPEYNYTKLTMKGTYDTLGVSLTDPAKIQQIANALHEGVFLQVNDIPCIDKYRHESYQYT